RQRNLDRGHARVLHDALVQLRLVLRDQADGDIGIEKVRIARPTLQDDQGVAIFGGHAGDVAGRSNGLSKIDHHGDLATVGDTQPKIVVEDVEDSIGIARQAALGKVAAVKAVIAFQGATKVGLGVRVAEAHAAAVVVQNQVTLAKHSRGQKLVERKELCSSILAERNQVANVTVKHEQGEGAGVVLFGEFARPVGQGVDMLVGAG